VASSPIRLLVSDIDGTLVTSDKRLTDCTADAVQRLHAAGIQFAMTSSRPPPGLAMYAAPLGVTTPLGAYNGGQFCEPTTLRVIDERAIPAAAVAPLVSTIEAAGLQAWVYRGGEWLVRDIDAWHVQHEARVVQFTPTRAADFGDLDGDGAAGVVKVVGVSQDHDAVAHVEAEIRAQLGTQVSATRSQAYYLDVTNPDANKGAVVDYLAAHFGVSHDEIAAIGDGPNDTLMFAKVGLSIAMGNGEPEVQQAATVTTAANDEDGFARAVEQYLLA
jgi:Cof subfamily protein (haloacid dehalogenase superfamily)